MSTKHSLDQLRHYHNEAIQFFASELMLLKEAIPKIDNDRLAKAGMLLMSCNQTGGAILQLASQADTFTNESIMLARAFIEKVTNFCYVGICDEDEYERFVFHPLYKNYHAVGHFSKEDESESIDERKALRIERQDKLRSLPAVQKALTIFSETNERLHWTKKTLSQRIETIRQWGEVVGFLFHTEQL
jgi:hypothetical protein